MENNSDATNTRKEPWKISEYKMIYAVLLADVFESLRDKYIEICKLDFTYFLSAPGLA